MFKNLFIILLLSSISFICFAADNRKLPLRDFFKNPAQTDFKVSYNGKYIASLRPWNERLNLFIQDISNERLPAGDIKQVTFLKDRNIGSYIWKGDNTLIYSKDFSGDENFHLYAIDIATGNAKDLTPFNDSRNEIFSTLETNSDTDILIKSNRRDKNTFDIYRLNVVTGTIKIVATNTGKLWQMLADHNGIVRIAIESDGKIGRMYSRNSNQEKFKEILEYDYTDNVIPLVFSGDNKYLYASSNIGRDKRAIVILDPNDGKEIRECFAHSEVDVDEIRFSPKRKKFLAAVYVTSQQQFHFFDAEAKKRINKIKTKLDNAQIGAGSSYNKNEDLFTYNITDDKGRAVYLYDQLKDKLTMLYDTDQYLPRNKLSNTRPIQYQARDGLTIHGYLTLPLHSSGTNLPVIVNPHGGPWNIRDTWGFNPAVQFLANRGYAVLQINYRGSHGYGKDFYRKSFRQWGLAMQDDITDGVKYLIDTKIADPTKIAIYGVSYGGYAALAGAAFTPELYACAIDVVGPSNLFTLLDTMPPYWSPVKQLWIERIGDPIRDKTLLEAISPVFHADKIKAPLLVAQGAKDPRVKRNESDQIVAALRKRGVEVEYIVKENEGHGFANEENRFELYAAMEKFLDRHILGNPPL